MIIVLNKTDTSISMFKIVNFCFIGYFFILWGVRRLVFLETFGQANMSIHREIYFWNIIMTLGNYIIYTFTDKVEIISIFSFVMTVVIILFSLFRFSYIYPELEYVNFVCKFLCLAFSGGQILFYYFNNELLYSIIILLIVVMFLERASVLKDMLCSKYIMLCKKSLHDQGSD